MANKSKQVMIAVDKLVQDFTFYPRTMVDSVHVHRLQDVIEAGIEVPPIKVCSKTFRIADGFHRYRAHLNLKRLEISALLIDYADDAAFYQDAVIANAAHGRGYSPFDLGRIIQRATELGLTHDKIALSLNVTPLKIEEIIRGFASNGEPVKTGRGFAQGGIPLKNTIRNKAGQALTPQQIDANNKLSGMNQAFYVNQIIILIEADLLDTGNQSLMTRIELLRKLLADVPVKSEPAVA